jgi:hypothetical protein
MIEKVRPVRALATILSVVLALSCFGQAPDDGVFSKLKVFQPKAGVIYKYTHVYKL